MGGQQRRRAAGPVGPLVGGCHPGADGAAHPAMDARCVLHAQHRGGPDGDDGGGLHAAPAGFRRIPLGAAADDPDAPVAERGLDPRGAAGRPHRPRRGGCGDRGVWPFSDWRQLCRGPDRVRHFGGDQLCGGDQGRRAHCRGVGPLHARCHARQADGGGCRPECRPD